MIAIANHSDNIDIANRISKPLHILLPEAKKLNLLQINSDTLSKQIVCKKIKRQLPNTVTYIHPLCKVSVCDMGITKVATMIVAISNSLKNQNPLCIHARGPLLDATPSVKIDISKKKNVTENDTLYIAMYPVSFIQFSDATVRSIHVALKSRNKDCKPL